MTNNDLNQMRKVIREEVSQVVDEKVSAILDQQISSSEKRIIGIIDEKISASEKRVIGGIGTFLSEQVLPLIDEKADKTDIERLERKLDRSLDTGMDHERRIKEIERVPVIAHQLRPKKSR